MRAGVVLVVLVVLVPACIPTRELSVSRDGLVAAGVGDRLVLVPLDGGPARHLRLGFEIDDLVWSPDGSTLAVVGSEPQTGKAERRPGLWLVRRDGVPRTLHAGPVWRPAWSPDGRRVAFLGGSELDKPDSVRYWLHVVDVATARVIRSVADVVSFDWHPDGTRLAAIVLEAPLTQRSNLYPSRLVELELAWPRRTRAHHRLTWCLLVILHGQSVRYAGRVDPDGSPDRILFLAAGPGSTQEKPLPALHAHDLARGRTRRLVGQHSPPTAWWFRVSPSRTRTVVASLASPLRLHLQTSAGWKALPELRSAAHLPGWISDDRLVVQNEQTLSTLDVKTGVLRTLISSLAPPKSPPGPPPPPHPLVARLGGLSERVVYRWHTRVHGRPTRVAWTAAEQVRVSTRDQTFTLDGHRGIPQRTEPPREPPGPPPLEDPLHPPPIAGPPGGHRFAAVTVGGQSQFGTFDVGRQRWIGRYVLDAPLAGPHVETASSVYLVTRTGQVMAFDRHKVDGLRIRWRRRLGTAATRLRYWRRASALVVTGERTLTCLSPASGDVVRTIRPGDSGVRLVLTHGLMLLLGRQGTTPWLGRLGTDGRVTWRVEGVERVASATGRRVYATRGAPGQLTLLEIDAAQGTVITRAALPAEVVCLGTGHDGPGEPLLLGFADGTVLRLTMKD